MKYLIFTFAFSSVLNAQTTTLPRAEIWSLGNEYYPVEKEAKSHRLISANCKSNKCQAYQALKDRKKKTLTKEDVNGGKNPGAVICTKYFNATIIILRDLKKNENAFCKFSDGSLVSASALM